MSIRKIYNNESIASIGVVLSVLCVISTLAQVIIDIVINSLGGGSVAISDLIPYFINTCFYLAICSYFIKGKSNFGYVYWAICMLLISSYVLPAILDIINSIVEQYFNLRTITFYLIYSGALLGILYFVFLCLNNKQRKKGYIITLIVLGAIMFVLGIVGFTTVLISSIGVIRTTIENIGQTSSNAAWTIILYAFRTLVSFVSIGFTIIYFLYPINLKRFD